MANTVRTLDTLMNAIFGVDAFRPSVIKTEAINKVSVDHWDATDLKKVAPMAINDNGDTKEEVYCLGSWIPGIKMANYRLPKDISANEMFTLMNKTYFEYWGGTGLNKGECLAVSGVDLGFTKAGESIAYLSLLKTPFAVDRDGDPYMFKMNVLVVKDQEMRDLGLVPGNTAILLAETRIQGQFRAMIGNSLLKGAAFSAIELKKIGIDVPGKLLNSGADLIVSEDHIKTNQLSAGLYDGFVGFTNDNTWTAKGCTGLSFEFFQYLKPDAELTEMFKAGIKISDDQLIFGRNKGGVLKAAIAGESYQPKRIDSATQNGYLAFGAGYPAVNNAMQKQVLGSLVKAKMPESSMALVVMTTDAVKGAISLNGNGNAILYKFPITAGLAAVNFIDNNVHFMAINESACNALNIDGDGDIAMVNKGQITDHIIKNKLLKDLRSLEVGNKTKKTEDFSLSNIAKAITGILKNTELIGKYTINYYIAEMLNDYASTNIDLSRFSLAIEKIIKTNKYNLDLSFLDIDARDMELGKLLKAGKELISMPWREINHKKALLEINVGSVSIEKAQKFVSGFRTESPIGYMDSIWNHLLDSAIPEIKSLEAVKMPLRSFAGNIELFNIENPAQHEAELGVLRSLYIRFNGACKAENKEDRKIEEISALVNQFSKDCSLSAISDMAMNFLNRSTGSGMFLLHCDHLLEITGKEAIAARTVSKKAIESADAMLAGKAIADFARVNRTVKVWKSRSVDKYGNKLNNEVSLDHFTIGSVVVVEDGKVCGYNINGVIHNGEYVVVSARQTGGSTIEITLK